MAEAHENGPGDVPRGPWSGRVAYSSRGGGYAYRPDRLLVDDTALQDALAHLRARGLTPRSAPVAGAEDALETTDHLVTVGDDEHFDVEDVVAVLRGRGLHVEPDYVLFADAAPPAGPCCGGGCVVPGACCAPTASPVYASPVYASPVYASPVYASGQFASPVYASPVYASPVYASPVYASPVYASHYRSSGERASSARPALPVQFTPPSPDPGGPRLVVLDTGIAGPGQLPPLLAKQPRLTQAPPEAHDPPDSDGDDFLDPASGHGTFIAGIVQLLAPRAPIEVHRVLSSFGDGDVSGIVGHIDALITSGGLTKATVLNLSFSGYADADMIALAKAIRRVRRTGAAVVASAGNDATCRPTYPACLPGVVSVGALDGDGPAPFSNHGPWVRACAPGTDLVSAFFANFNGKAPVPPMPKAADPDEFSGWARWSGTSFAAPVVAAALLREIARSGGTADDAVHTVVDAPGLYRLHCLGTVVNLVTPTPDEA